MTQTPKIDRSFLSLLAALLFFSGLQFAAAKSKNGDSSASKSAGNSAPSSASGSSYASVNGSPSGSAIGIFEQRLFFRQYADEDENSRLSRIEKQVFGEVYGSDNATDRIARINGALPPLIAPTSEAPAPQATPNTPRPAANSYRAPAPDNSQDETDAQEKQRLSVMSAKEEEVANLLSEGVRLWRAKQGPAAIEKFEQAIRLDPDNSQAHFSLGVAYEAKGALSQAQMHYRSAAALDPTNKDYNQAIKSLEPKLATQQKASAKQTEVANLTDDAGKAYRAGEYLSALDLYKQLDEKSPRQALVKWNIGTIYLIMKNPMLALTYYKEASKLKPNDQHYADAVSQLEGNLKQQEVRDQQTQAAWDRSAGPERSKERSPAPIPITPPRDNRPSQKVPELLQTYGVTAKNNHEGVKITDIALNSRGAQVGLKVGDVIKAVDGNIIENVEEINQLIFAKPPGQRFQFTVQREKRLGPLLF